MSRLIGTAIVVWVIAALAILSPPSVVKGQVPMTGAGLGAPSGGASCSFPSLAGLIAHWRADTNVTTSSGNVTSVGGTDGTSFTLTNSGTVPFTSSSSYNSHPAFNFTAANNASLVNSSFGIGTGGTASVFVVGRMTASVVSFGGAVAYGVGAGSDFNTAGAGALLTNNNGTAGIESAVNGNTTINTSMTEAANHRFGLVAVTGASWTQYVDNVAGSNALFSNTWTNNGTIVIGNRYLSGAAGGAAWDGPILDIVISNADETSHLNALDTYFTCQWGT